MPDGDWRRASFLEPALGTSIAVTIGEGASVRQDLRIP
jgi:hypothetical protein